MEIELPDGTILEAPDDADPSAVARAYISKRGVQQSRAASANTDPSLYNKSDALTKAGLRTGRDLARAVGLAGRTIMNTAAAPPLMAMDAGVAARNLIGGGNYQMPTQMWNEALNDAGVPQFETPIEKGGDIAGQMLLGSRLPIPQINNSAPTQFSPQSMRALALRKAQEAGYAVPPSTTNPTVLNRLLESIGGKAATAQDASLRNQAVTDKLVKADLGLKASDDVGEGTLAVIRQEAAANGYAPVREIGTIRLDSKFETAIDDVVGKFTKVAKQFPKLSKSDITDVLSSLKTKSVDSDVAVDTIALLRSNADEAFAGGNKQAGQAYKAAAKAMEDAVERSLGRRGADAKEVLSGYRDARQLIAKTYTAEKALNPELGSFDARKLAQELNKGRPISGDMKKAAQASQAFKDATRLLTDSGSVRNTDVILGGIGAIGTANPAPLLYPFSRMALRDLLLSPAGQRLAQPSAQYGLPPSLVMGGTSGLLGASQ